MGGMRESGRWEGTVILLGDGEKHKPLGFWSFSNSMCKILKKKKALSFSGVSPLNRLLF